MSQEEFSQNEREILIPGFGERFLEAFGGKKQIEIAEMLEVATSAITNYTKGRVPKTPLLLKMWRLTNCDLHWLLTGERSRPFEIMAPSPSIPLDESERIVIEQLAQETNQTTDQIQRELLIEALRARGLLQTRKSSAMIIFRHDIKLVALLLIGSLSSDQPIKFFEKSKQRQVMIAETFIPPEYAGYQFCLLQIEGDGVEGLQEGDCLICCDNRNPTSDSVVIASINGGNPAVKRVFFEGPNVRLQPYNNKSPGEIYPAEQVEILYTVTGINRTP